MKCGRKLLPVRPKTLRRRRTRRNRKTIGKFFTLYVNATRMAIVKLLALHANEEKTSSISIILKGNELLNI